jgi:hypothetical protein
VPASNVLARTSTGLCARGGSIISPKEHSMRSTSPAPVHHDFIPRASFHTIAIGGTVTSAKEGRRQSSSLQRHEPNAEI